MIPNEIIFARDKLVKIAEETFNINGDELILKQRGRGRKFGVTTPKAHIVYLCIIWLLENKRVSRSIAAKCFNRHGTISSNAIRMCRRLIECRDAGFGDLLDEFNEALSKNGMRPIAVTQIRLNSAVKKLTREETRSIKFMLKHDIPVEEISKHFKVNEATIDSIKAEYKNQSE